MNLLEAIKKLHHVQQHLAVYDGLVERLADRAGYYPWEGGETVSDDVLDEVKEVLLERREELEKALEALSNQEIADGKPKRKAASSKRSKQLESKGTAK